MPTTGHWSSLAEAQKATESVLLSGIIETVIEANGLLSMVPVRQLSGQDLKYDREVSWNAEDGAQFLDQEEQLGWSSDITYTQVTVDTKEIARQDRIDYKKAGQYSSVNDYRSLLIQEVTKRVARFADFHMFYGDIDFNAKQFDGLHTINKDGSADVAAASADETSLNIDMGEAALSLATLRLLLNNCKIEQKGRDNVAILCSPTVASLFDAAYQEGGFVRSGVTHSLAQIQFGAREIGGRVLEFDGVPIIRTDFLVAEQANTGVDSAGTRRTRHASGDKQYSLFVVRFGELESGGLELVFGDPDPLGSGGPVGEGEFRGFARSSFDKLEGYTAGGERVWSYITPALGALHSLGRIFDIENVAIVP